MFIIVYFVWYGVWFSGVVVVVDFIRGDLGLFVIAFGAVELTPLLLYGMVKAV